MHATAAAQLPGSQQWRSATISAFHLLGEVDRQGELLDEGELCLEIVHMLFFVLQNLFQEIGGGVVGGLAAGLDRFVVSGDGALLECKVVLELPRHVLADTYGSDFIHLRQPSRKRMRSVIASACLISPV